VRGALLAVETLPALLPVRELLFGALEFLVESAFGGLREFQFRREFFDLFAQARDLPFVALDVRIEFGERGARLGEFVALLVTQLARVKSWIRCG
jgi:hypothetical protein